MLRAAESWSMSSNVEVQHRRVRRIYVLFCMYLGLIPALGELKVDVPFDTC